MKESLLPGRLMANPFGAIVVLLPVVGQYGVQSYIVARRQNEIGIRSALGADRASILRMMLGDVVMLRSIGLTEFAICTSGLAAARILNNHLRQRCSTHCGAGFPACRVENRLDARARASVTLRGLVHGDVPRITQA